MTFNFDEWSNTLKMMVDEGFISKKTITKLTIDLIKKGFKWLSVTQGLMLQEEIEALQMKPRRASPSERNEAPESDFDDVARGDVIPSSSRIDPVNIRQLAQDKDPNELLESLKACGNPGDWL